MNKKSEIIILCTIGLLCAFSGIYYISFEYNVIPNYCADRKYVIILIISTIILLFGYYNIKKYIFYTINGFLSKKPDDIKEKMYSSILKSLEFKKSVMFGILFGIAAFGSFSIIIDIWKEYFYLKILLSIFQLFVGVACGLGLYSLFVFIYKISQLSKLLTINFFHIHDPETIFILNSTQRVALLTSIYVFLSMTGIVFSRCIPFDKPYIYSFIIFSFSCILVAYFIPLIPVYSKMKSTKNFMLFEIEESLLPFLENVENQNKICETDIAKLDTLLKLRKEISSIQNWPFTIKWITTTISVFTSALIPIAMKYFFNL